MYDQVKLADGRVLSDTIWRTSDGAFIPVDPQNADYQEYLAWVAAGNQLPPA